MKRYVVLLCVFSIVLAVAGHAGPQGSETFLYDDFHDLANWKEMYFKKIPGHTKYTIENEGDTHYLKAESNASASGIVMNREFSVFEYPRIKWRWKISNTYVKGDARKKSGDDYPLRVYIVFKYDPEASSFGKRMRYELVKNLYGEYPPDSTLNYIWANRRHTERVITNTYSAEAKMIVLQTGNKNAGVWIEQDINIIEDYHRAFKEDPPDTASVAIMSDSDNTGESATAYIDYIKIYR